MEIHKGEENKPIKNHLSFVVFKLRLKYKEDVMGQRFVVLVGICFCGCENQGQKVERLIKESKHRKAKVRANAAMALFHPMQ